MYRTVHLYDSQYNSNHVAQNDSSKLFSEMKIWNDKSNDVINNFQNGSETVK